MSSLVVASGCGRNPAPAKSEVCRTRPFGISTSLFSSTVQPQTALPSAFGSPGDSVVSRGTRPSALDSPEDSAVGLRQPGGLGRRAEDPPGVRAPPQHADGHGDREDGGEDDGQRDGEHHRRVLRRQDAGEDGRRRRATGGRRERDVATDDDPQLGRIGTWRPARDRCSLPFFSRALSEVWPRHGRAFSTYLILTDSSVG